MIKRCEGYFAVYLCILNTPESVIKTGCTLGSLHILRADALTGFVQGDGCVDADEMTIAMATYRCLHCIKSSSDATAEFGRTHVLAVDANKLIQHTSMPEKCSPCSKH